MCAPQNEKKKAEQNKTVPKLIQNGKQENIHKYTESRIGDGVATWGKVSDLISLQRAISHITQQEQIIDYRVEGLLSRTFYSIIYETC